MPILQRWPGAYHDLLDDLVDRNPEPTQKNLLRRRFATEMGLLAIRPTLDLDGSQIEVITAELKRFCLEHLDYRWGQRKPSKPQVLRVSAKASASKPLIRPKTRVKKSGVKKARRAIDTDHLSLAATLDMLEGNPTGSIAAWTEAGLVNARETRNISFSRAAVQALADRIGSLTGDQPPPDSVPLVQAAKEIGRGAYRKSHLLADLVAGRLEVFDRGFGQGIARFAILPQELKTLQIAGRLRGIIAANGYLQLCRANKYLEELWGHMSTIDVAEAQQWIAVGRLRFRYEFRVYGRRSFPRYVYHAGDLVQISQEIFRPIYFETTPRR